MKLPGGIGPDAPGEAVFENLLGRFATMDTTFCLFQPPIFNMILFFVFKRCRKKPK